MKKILITPVKNEAHYLPAFLAHHAPLFDVIIIADQNSTDGSREIAASHPKVCLVKNQLDEYNERTRRNLLLEKAYELAERPLIVGLDADEFLLTDKTTWDRLTYEHGMQQQILRFPWMALRPDRKSWVEYEHVFCNTRSDGMLDEGFIHLPRVPLSGSQCTISEVVVLHLNLFFPKRQQMKTWWYMALEATRRSSKIVDLHRLYLKSATGVHKSIQPVPERWRSDVDEALGRLSVSDTWDTWQLDALVEMLTDGRHKSLQKVDIWGYPWSAELASRGLVPVQGPSIFFQLLFLWFRTSTRPRLAVCPRIVDAVLRLVVRW